MLSLGIDVGGSGIKGAPVDVTTGCLAAERHRIPTPQPATPKAVVATVRKLVKHFDWWGPIGCGFPSAFQGGIVRTATNIDKAWLGRDASAYFGRKVGQPVTVLNDADAAGIAEMKFGAGRGRTRGVVIVVTIGTGLGSAVFTNGLMLPNTELGSGIEIDGRMAESFASDAARKSEKMSWKRWAGHFNQYLLKLEHLFWPDLFILGGGASKKAEKFLQYLEVQGKVVTAELRNEAGIVGAALAATRD